MVLVIREPVELPPIVANPVGVTEAQSTVAETTGQAATVDVIALRALYPLHTEWTWHAHTDANAGYGGSVITLGTFGTVLDFWNLYDHIPHPGDVLCGSARIFLPSTFSNGCTVNGFAVFRKGIEPAWEDARNADGCDLCARGTFSAEKLTSTWRDLLGLLIHEGFPPTTVGIRVAFKCDRRTSAILHKFEVWSDGLDTQDLKSVLTEYFPSLAFQTVLHKDAAAQSSRPHVPRTRVAKR